MLTIELVILGVQDFEKGARWLRTEFGLGCVDGFVFPDMGVECRVVPLGSQIIEVLAVRDPVQAKGNWFGRRLMKLIAEGDRLLGWSVHTDDLERVASRLGRPPLPGFGVDPTGVRWGWRIVGMDVALGSEPFLPMFFTWDDHEAILKRYREFMTRAQHEAEPLGISWIEVSGDRSRLDTWLGDERLPVVVNPGPPGVRAVGIETTKGVIVLGDKL